MVMLKEYSGCLVLEPFAGQFAELYTVPSAVQSMAMLIDSFSEKQTQQKTEFCKEAIITIIKWSARNNIDLSFIYITATQLHWINK